MALKSAKQQISGKDISFELTNTQPWYETITQEL